MSVAAEPMPAAQQAVRSLWRCSWLLPLMGGLTMAAVQPPWGLWWAAWVAPLPWLLVARRRQPLCRRDWSMLWCGGAVYWMAVLHWLRLPHPATSVGWVALSAYLACFLPCWVAATRWFSASCRMHFVASAPLAWLGVEHLRGWLFGGFTMGGLCDTQVHWLAILQTVDLCGGVGLSGVIMAVAALLAEAVNGWLEEGHSRCVKRSLGFAGGAAGVIGLTLAYGTWRLSEEPAGAARHLKVLLVQGAIDTELKQDLGAAERVAREYDELTLQGLREALETGAHPDLIVWPETMWRWGLLEIDPTKRLPAAVVRQALGPAADGIAADDDETQAAARQRLSEERLEPLAAFARRYGTTWLVGLDKQVISPGVAAGVRNYNCGLFLDAEGTALGCYEKMYPVLFGEYVPLADRFPWLYRLTPLPAGLTAGTSPLAVEVAGFEVASTICYETALPRAIRSIVRELTARRKRPDVIANLTNDGWFWGSSELDMHLSAAILRAVEVRTPIVVAANTGISAWIDGSGRVRRRGPKRATATVLADVFPDGRWSPFLSWGSLPTGLAGLATAFAVVAACRKGSRVAASRR